MRDCMSNEVQQASNKGVLKAITPQENQILCDMVICALETLDERQLDVNVPIEHFIFDGVYYRTCRIPKGVAIVGALIKIPTTVIVSGDCLVSLGLTIGRLTGYNVVRAEAFRRQAFKALEDTCVTMCFKTNAKDVKEAEKEFTDEWKLLTTNREELLKECQEW